MLYSWRSALEWCSSEAPWMFKLRCWEGGGGEGGERRVGELSPMSHISAHKSPCPPHCQLCYSTLFRNFLHLNTRLSWPLPYNVMSANSGQLVKNVRAGNKIKVKLKCQFQEQRNPLQDVKKYITRCHRYVWGCTRGWKPPLSLNPIHPHTLVKLPVCPCL